MSDERDLREALRMKLLGYRVSAIISTFAALDMADALHGAPSTATELAERAGLDPISTARLLRAAVGAGLVELDADGRYHSTASGALLRRSQPGSMHTVAASVCRDDHWRPWGALAPSVRDGVSGFERIFGASQSAWLAARPEESRAFDAKMTAVTARVAAACAEAVDFGRFSCIADIGGGGRGTLISAILEAAPKARGILFDLPVVVTEAAAALAEAGLSDRCTVVGGDFFEVLPAGADAHVLKWVLHTWSDDDCVRILTRCRQALPADGRLFVIETIMPDEPGDLGRALRDLNMLLMGTGLERTASAFDALLARSGFERVDRVETGTPYAILEARPLT